MLFHERLKQLRIDTMLSQKEFAEKWGIDTSKYNKWENGKNSPDFDNLCFLAKNLNVTTDYLLGLSDFKNSQSKAEFSVEIEELAEKLKKIKAQDDAWYQVTVSILSMYLSMFNCKNVTKEYKAKFISQINKIIESYAFQFAELDQLLDASVSKEQKISAIEGIDGSSEIAKNYVEILMAVEKNKDFLNNWSYASIGKDYYEEMRRKDAEYEKYSDALDFD